MKKVNTDLLQVGDIILTTSTQKTSALIRKVTNSDISHAMICVARGSVMDSTSEGVQARNIQKMFYSDDSAIYVLRAKEALSPSALAKIVEYARSSTGTSYSKAEAAAVVTGNGLKMGSAKQFCSRMVARAYDSAGITLVNNVDFCSPEDLKNSDALIKIEPSWLIVSTEERDAMSKQEDTTMGMRGVTEDLLRRVRVLDKKIENLNDIDDLLIACAELDIQISESFTLSGYLDYWKIDVSRFPWRYDPLLMVQLYHSTSEKEDLIKYCRDTLADHEAGAFSHWDKNAKGYAEKNRIYPRRTFELLSNLYMKLSFNHNERIRSARILLGVYGSNN